MPNIPSQSLTIGISIFLLSLFPSLNAQAQNEVNKIELKVYSENDQKQSCPEKVIVTEIPRPYQEGGFATDGSVNLSEYANNISITAKNSFSTTWVGTLKPKYSKCSAAAGITKINGEKYTDNTNYLRLHFVKGKVYFMLDLAGGYDANDYPLVVVKQGIKNGNPVWTWGGTD
ncbi:hypothetical protein VB713_28045 [Anabaena cylindrica UHCC 0172]|uniref:hypothetical protein n=1 Tax=Anabaena cylindrica TaxID=1165 RepID=UPI002B1FC536|nr:hypothetical protein [Anabaena cylindrica]MEA5554780.1 hypothetical protein [Anabaena cylindrica UHCC 0172]